MFRAVVLCLGFAAGSAFAGGAVTVRVVTPDGKPAVGAKVWVGKETFPAVPPAPLVADAAGVVTLPANPAKYDFRQLFVADAAGRVGGTYLNTHDEEPVSVVVTLTDVAARAGRVTTADGKPVAGAVVTPKRYSAPDDDRRRDAGPPRSIPLPPWEQKPRAVTTDADGRFRLPAPAAGFVVAYQITAAGFGEADWYAGLDAALDATLLVPGTLVVAVAGLDPALLKGFAWDLAAKADPPGPGGRRSYRRRYGTFDGTAGLTVRDLVPGDYELTAQNDGTIPALFEKPVAVAVGSGATATATAKFGPATTVTGRVVDKDGKGVPKVRASVNVRDGGTSPPRAYLSAETDAAGNYVVHGPAGWYTVGLQNLPAGYAHPAYVEGRPLAEPVKVEVGKTHAFGPIAVRTEVKFVVRVALADGKPAAGATLQVGHALHQMREKFRADKDGQFTVPGLPPDDALTLRARLGTAVNVPATIDLDKVDGPVAVEISEANAAAFKGRVTDAKGQPLAGAKAALHHHIQGVGRQSQYSSSTVTATATTDADGRYGFAAQWPGDDYRVAVTAAGFANAEGKQFRGEAGKTHELADLKLTRSSLVVRGTVIGPDGKPAAGAEVFSVDGQDRASATSAADGSFSLDGCPETLGFVFARKGGFKLAVLLVAAGDGKPVQLALAAADGKPVPPPEISADHRAALDAATRHALTLVWDSDAAFGYGSNALLAMAEFDPATAAKWRDAAKARTGGKTDFARLLDQAARQKTLFDAAKADPDEALAVVAGLTADTGFHEAARVGELMLTVDKATALRFAEEAVVKARQRRLPDRIWSLARAGDLAVQAGNAAGGKKVLAEAADLAAKLTPDVNGRNSLAVGLAAAHLAPHDADKADKMLDTLTDPSDYNRCLAAAASRVARVDLGRAKALLGRFKPSNTFYFQEARLRIAYAVGAAQPDEAVKMIDSVPEASYRFLGHVRLAALTAPTDKARAFKAIDDAFAVLEREPKEFLTGGNCAATFGTLGAIRAKELGYPDVPDLVVRSLALRPTGLEARSPEFRENNAMDLAGILALVDPATARLVLITVGTSDRNARTALSKGRHWLLNLSLAEPERAPALADSVFAQAKKVGGSGNAMSNSGLVELGSTLTAPDRLKRLTMWTHLPREVGDDD